MVAGDMVLKEGAAIEFEANPINNADAHGDLPSGVEHWRMYHHFEPPPQPKDPASFVGGFSDELRMTMPAGTGTMNRVVIGCFSEQGKFTPILAVLDDQTVEVYGTLNVKGEISGRIADAPAGAVPGTPSPPNPQSILDNIDKFLGSSPLTQDAVVDLLVKDSRLSDFAGVVSDLNLDKLKTIANTLWVSNRDSEPRGTWRHGLESHREV